MVGKRAEFARLFRSGVVVWRAALQVGVSESTGRRWAGLIGEGRFGVAPEAGRLAADDEGMRAGTGSRGRLTAGEREEIGLSRAAGWSVTRIAGRLGRSKATVSRELARNRCEDGVYRPSVAQVRADRRARRPKPAKLARPGRLRQYVAGGLAAGWSPEQVSRRLRADFPEDETMRACPETVYQAVYVQARGGLKREVEQALRQGRAYRRPRRQGAVRQTRIQGMVGIADRPPEAADRAVPGHWEGDLITGRQNQTAVSTLVERTTRFTMLGHLPGDHGAAAVQDAIVPLLRGLPDMMRRSLTWDQGIEMAGHVRIAAAADIQVYFCDPHSPWQRGTNENTNGLLRQYLPKGSDLSVHSAEDLAVIAALLNGRPRKTLNWLTPAEAYALLVGEPVTVGGRDAWDRAPDFLKAARQAVQSARADG
jgi:IS30 family transposase